jgi:hypothetical protein
VAGRKGDWIKVEETLGMITDIHRCRPGCARQRGYLVPNSTWCQHHRQLYPLLPDDLDIPSGGVSMVRAEAGRRIMLEVAQRSPRSPARKTQVLFTEFADSSLNRPGGLHRCTSSAGEGGQGNLYFAIFEEFEGRH